VFCIFKTFSFFCFSLPPSCINMHIFSGSWTRVIWFLSIIFLIIMPLIGMTRVWFLNFLWSFLHWSRILDVFSRLRYSKIFFVLEATMV
jgi:hypothetical protein